MKILLVNGSPHEHGGTGSALSMMAERIRRRGMEAEVFWTGSEPVLSCIACGLCKRGTGCFYDDCVNLLAQKCREADGFVFGSPVHYGGISGTLQSILGRLFYSAGGALRHKPAVGVSVCRRGGAMHALFEIEKYFSFLEMPLISSVYPCILYGSSGEEIQRDEEGMQTLQIAAENLCYYVHALTHATEDGILPPPAVERVRTPFIR